MKISNKKNLLFLSLALCMQLGAFAQTGTIRGFVYEKKSGDPAMFVNVILKGTSFGVATDIDGFYTLSKVPPGDYTLFLSALGYDSISKPITVKANEVATHTFYLDESTQVLQDVNVSAARMEAKTEVKTGVTKISPMEIKQLPSIGGEPDLAQYLQVLPGVVFTGDQGGQLYIRGGAPIHNKVLLDGMIVYNPFHSIGFFSVFDTDIIKGADVYTGGFSAEYGGRISSVMDIRTREGNKKRMAGKVAVSPFGSKLLMEGPLSKKDENGNAKTTFLFSGKTSYLEQTSKVLYTNIDSNGLPFNYTDVYSKLSFMNPNGSRMNLFGFNFSDQVKFSEDSRLNWKSYGGGSDFTLVPGSSPVLIKGSFAYSQYSILLKNTGEKDRKSDISGFNMGMNFTYFLGDDSEFNYGFEILGFNTNFKFFNSAGRIIQQEDHTTELAGYMKYKYVSTRLILEPSFRAQHYASLGIFSPEPRFGMKFNIDEKTRLKASAGFYSQNLVAANSDRDVVNLFYGFLSSPDNYVSTFNGEAVSSSIQKARHLIAGVEYDLTDKIDVNLEGYVKHFNQLTSINRQKIYQDEQPYSNVTSEFYQPEHLRKDFIIEEGLAKGVDLLIKYRDENKSLWLVYSLGKVSRKDGQQEYVPHYDRRHNVNLVATYKFGEDKSWEIDGRWNLGSGFPFTPTQGYYESPDLSQGVNVDYVYGNGNLQTIYGDLNSRRLPYYHRLDLSVKKFYEFTEFVRLEWNVSVTNAYNRQNIFYVDRVTNERVDQLPLMPSAGVSITF